ncbi:MULTISPECIES: DUF2510 domain-containing protein [unclassified Curtobacterium]|uniref:DUF2510 domain-containing protein n=1 Tax=unclassified Curtobacterium TaxID=257496 RepID=UPI000FACB21B|nr:MULTISPECIES: DUF2510 domain-containing protein [unclassified Curtobacterium]ROP64883.1 uncharacterized protein DUF2510 [Curtobacterium sp. ZW137]
MTDDVPVISCRDHVDRAPSPDSGRNSRGGTPRFRADLLVQGLATKKLRTTGESWFTSWRRRQQGFADGQFRLVPEEGNPADATAVGVWLDDEQVAYIYGDDAERYTAALTHVGCNLLVNAVQTEDGLELRVEAPAPRALKKLLRTADPSTFVPLPAPVSIAAGPRAGHDMRRYPAPVGDYSLPPSVWWPITGGRRSGGTTADSPGAVSTCPLCLNPMDQTTARRVNATRNKTAARMICPECFIEIGPGERPRGVELTPDQIVASMKQYHAVTGAIPRQGGSGYAFLDKYPRSASPEELLAFLRLIWDWPDRSTVNEVFGSWHGALAASGVLGDGTERMSRGVRSIANDGHLCLSYGERTIDDWLHKQGIAHTREPSYPGTNYRGDFLVGDLIIEYLGLHGDPDYDARFAAKRRAAKRAGLDIFEITPRTLGDWDTLALRLARRPARWAPTATPVSPAPTAEPLTPVPEGPTGAPGWRTDPLNASGRRYFDGSAWTHHTLDRSGEWHAHTPLGDAARSAAQAWVRHERPMREAPEAALGKLGTHPDGLAFWLAAIDEHENGGQARAADSATAPAYRGFIRYLERDGAAMMAAMDRCARFDRAGSRTLNDRALHIFHQAGVRPDFAAAGLTFHA